MYDVEKDVGGPITRSGEYAGLGPRFVAWLLDQSMIQAIVVVTVVAAGALYLTYWSSATPYELRRNAIVSLVPLVELVVNWVWFAAAESSSWRASPGKRLVGLRVSDGDGRRIGRPAHPGRPAGYDRRRRRSGDATDARGRRRLDRI